MTYFADFSLYAYHTFQPVPDPKLLNIGWLDPRFPFIKGPVDSSVVGKLLQLCQKPVNLCRGWHHCPYGALESSLSPCPCPVRMHLESEVIVGNGEIRISGEDGVVYAAPTLLCHYIERHGYRPPVEFIQAVAKL